MFGGHWLAALRFKLGMGGGLGRSYSRRVRRRTRPSGLAISNVESLENRALLGSLISQPAILGALVSDSYTAAATSSLLLDLSSGTVSSASLSNVGVSPLGGFSTRLGAGLLTPHGWDTLSATLHGAENKTSGSSSATASNSSTDNGHAPQLVRSVLPSGLTGNLSASVFGHALFDAFDDFSTSGRSSGASSPRPLSRSATDDSSASDGGGSGGTYSPSDGSGGGPAASVSAGNVSGLVPPPSAGFGSATAAPRAAAAEPPPSVSIGSTMLPEGDADQRYFEFPVSLSSPSSEWVSVWYSLDAGSATPNNDYASGGGAVEFAPGTVWQMISIPVYGDTQFEPDETFFVRLTNATNSTIQEGSNEGTGFIINDDGSGGEMPMLLLNDASVSEGNSGTTFTTFTVSLTTLSTSHVTVQYATSNNTAQAESDYYPVQGGTVTIPAGSMSAMFSIAVVADTTVEPDEAFNVNLFNASNATILDGDGKGTIQNDDYPSLSINSVDVTEGNAGTTSAVFTVSLSLASTETVTVQYSTQDVSAAAPTDYTAVAFTTLAFAPGVTSQSITVPVYGDTLGEDDETFLVRLTNATHATLAVNGSFGIGTIVNDDGSALSISDWTAFEQHSGTTPATFTVSLVPASTQTVTVEYATTDGTAYLGADYFGVGPTTLTFAPGATSQTVSVPVSGDTLTELDEWFFINLSNPVNAALADAQGRGTIRNDDAYASINDVSVTEGHEGLTDATFTVSLSAVNNLPVTMNYSTASGTATAEFDFQGTSRALTFSPGAVSQTVTVRIFGDTHAEDNETFFVNLSNPVNATFADGQGLGTIRNDDTAIMIDDVTVIEGHSGETSATFSVSLGAPASEIVTVSYATSNGTAAAPTDFVPVSGSLTFAPGVTSLPVEVHVRGDLLVEPTESFFVNLSGAANALIVDGQGAGTIVTDDTNLSINDVLVLEGDSGTTVANFTISLSYPIPDSVTMLYSTQNDTALAPADYTAVPYTLLTIPAGATSAVISVAVVGDTVGEPDERFVVNLLNVTHAAVTDGQGQATILNDDLTLSIDDLTLTEGDSGNTLATFTVSLSAAGSQPVTVQYATAPDTAVAPGDFAAVGPATLTFAPGETSRTISVAIVGDTFAEADERFFLNLWSASGAVIVDGLGQATIWNDDSRPALSINDVQIDEGHSGSATATFSVSLSKPSDQPVTATYGTADGSATAPFDYAGAFGQLTFGPGQTALTISVTVFGDTLNEASETFFVNLSNVSGADLADVQGQGTIRNDDMLISIDDVTVTEGDSHLTWTTICSSPDDCFGFYEVVNDLTSATFTITLSTSSTDLVYVSYRTENLTAQAPQDYHSSGTRLLFWPGMTSLTVTVPVIGDTNIEPDERFVVQLFNAENATLADDVGVGTIADDDNSPPTISSIPDQSIDEDTATADIPFTVSDPDPEHVPESLSVTASSSNQYLVSAGGILVAGNGSDRTVKITPQPNQTGKTHITLTVLDPAGLSSSTTFTLYVNEPSCTDAQVTDMVLEWLDADGNWQVLGDADEAWTEDELRWTPVYSPIGLDVSNVTWYFKPWSDRDNADVPWAALLGSSGSLTAYGNPGEGDWAVRPAVDFDCGAVAFLQAPKNVKVAPKAVVSITGDLHAVEATQDSIKITITRQVGLNLGLLTRPLTVNFATDYRFLDPGVDRLSVAQGDTADLDLQNDAGLATLQSGLITIPATKTSVSFTVRPIRDNRLEKIEQVRVFLREGEGYRVIPQDPNARDRRLRPLSPEVVLTVVDGITPYADERVDQDDIRQGSIGDCWVLAALAAMAAKNPAFIEGLITPDAPNQDKYRVAMYRNIANVWQRESQEVVRANMDRGAAQAQLSGDVDANGNAEIWPQLLEKAYGQYVSLFGDGWPALDRGNMAGRVWRPFTGNPHVQKALKDFTEAEFAALVNGNNYVVVGTKADLVIERRETRLFPSHAYAVVGYENGKFTLYNPHGKADEFIFLEIQQYMYGIVEYQQF
jgi:hypothetical protein